MEDTRTTREMLHQTIRWPAREGKKFFAFALRPRLPDRTDHLNIVVVERTPRQTEHTLHCAHRVHLTDTWELDFIFRYGFLGAHTHRHTQTKTKAANRFEILFHSHSHFFLFWLLVWFGLDCSLFSYLLLLLVCCLFVTFGFGPFIVVVDFHYSVKYCCCCCLLSGALVFHMPSMRTMKTERNISSLFFFRFVSFRYQQHTI